MRWRWWLVAILCLAEGLNLSAWMLQARCSSDPFVDVDSARYIGLAHGLIRDGWFHATNGADDTGLSHVPGYPIFLAGLMLCHLGQPAQVALIQHVLLLAAVGLTFGLGKTLFGPRVGLIAAAIQAASLASVAYGNEVLTEALFVALLAGGLWGLIHFGRTGRWRYLALASALLAAALFTRPVMLYAGVPLALVLVASCARTIPPAKRFAAAGLLLAGLLACTAAWTYRNERVSGVATFCAIQAQNLAYWNAAGVLQSEHGWSLARAQTDVRRRIESRPHASIRQAYQAKLTVAKQILQADPAGAIKPELLGMARVAVGPSTWCDLLGGKRTAGQILAQPARTLADWRYSLPLGLEMAQALLTWLAALVGLWRCRRMGKGWLAAALALLVLYFWVVSGGPAGTGRYRVAFWPVVSVLAAAAFARGNTQPAQSPEVLESQRACA